MCACKAPKDVIYFQGIDDLTPDELAEMSQAYTIKIENDDLLSINVTAWDPVALWSKRWFEYFKIEFFKGCF